MLNKFQIGLLADLNAHLVRGLRLSELLTSRLSTRFLLTPDENTRFKELSNLCLKTLTDVQRELFLLRTRIANRPLQPPTVEDQ